MMREILFMYIRMSLYHKMAEGYFGTVVGPQFMMHLIWGMQGKVDL